MKKITISVPQKEKDKWKLHWSGKGKHFISATTLFLGIERRLLRLANKEKLAIRVKYTKDTFNETIPSQNALYLLYATSCFLEDYLSRSILGRIRKQYLAGENN